jgi:8-oxo-dGTP pyrophosphatase MutT (NUDIX family)
MRERSRWPPATEKNDLIDETKNPWTVVTKETVYENAWIRVDHHEVRNPSGGPGVYGTVHFKGHALGVVPIDEKGNTILVGQFRFPLGYYSWEIPQGGGEKNVPLLESAKRELREECGMAAKKWLPVLGMDLSNSVTDEQGTAFLAWDLTEGVAEPEETEALQVVRLPFWEAVDKVKRGEIRDLVSVAALLRIALMSAQGELPDPVDKLLWG